MFQALSQKTIEEMDSIGHILITVKSGWETAGTWSSQPHNISYCLGGHSKEHIFTCYILKESATVQVTSIEATELISDKKCLVDAYLVLALKGLMDYAKYICCDRLIVDSWIPSIIDHMLDLGFTTQPRGSFSSIRGIKKL
jgi:hypothetical protein